MRELGNDIYELIEKHFGREVLSRSVSFKYEANSKGATFEVKTDTPNGWEVESVFMEAKSK